MSTTPFHDIADQMDALAEQVRGLGDAVHTGSYTVPVPEPEEPGAEGPGSEGPGDGEGESPDQSILTTSELPAE